MKVHVYQGAGGQYLHVPSKSDFSRVPGETLKKLGGTARLAYLKEYESSHQELIGVNGRIVDKEITTKGYYVNKVEVQLRENGGSVTVTRRPR